MTKEEQIKQKLKEIYDLMEENETIKLKQKENESDFSITKTNFLAFNDNQSVFNQSSYYRIV
jgi:hypothetical protein